MIILSFFTESVFAFVEEAIEVQAVIVDLIESEFVWFRIMIEEMLKALEIMLVILKGFLGTIFGDLAVFEKFANVLGKFH